MNDKERIKIIEYASSPYVTENAPSVLAIITALATEILELRAKASDVKNLKVCGTCSAFNSPICGSLDRFNSCADWEDGT